MPDQAAVLAIVVPPATVTECAGPALDTDAGARVIPLDTRRRRPSPEMIARSKALHPAQARAAAGPF